ncbi:conjugal transfer protein MobB [Flavobacterium limi]|uniref:Mobilization protein n=1 Tax=Flavobacterium limi TaxID=2045105 RepID=A0ABQ1UAD3_9FLAO|nr:conjugal transfer protein MobB [Flavobacterium limi]GGF14357.1 mobilization protein [Flavobacterium limi]
MIAKIGRGSNLYGTLEYNLLKVQKDEASVVFTSKIIETVTGQYSAAQLARSFQTLLALNRNTEKPVIHISLNPDPKDIVDDDRFREMAAEYMVKMGYGQQPFAVFKHTDIEREHIHIVTICVDEEGKKISDKFEKRRSMAVCRELERKYGLISAQDKAHGQQGKIFNPVDYRAADVKSQIAAVIRYLPKYYQFQTLGEYNALLSLFNITTEKVESHLHGKIRQGLLYLSLNENGERAGHPLKASLFGKNLGLPALDIHFGSCKKALKENSGTIKLKDTIRVALHSTDNEMDFKNKLLHQDINTVVRRNETGRIYGITFIDHNFKTVWNGSRLGAEFSANIFNKQWSNDIIQNTKESLAVNSKIVIHNLDDLPDDNPHELFKFLNNENGAISQENNFSLGAFGGLLPEANGEDYAEDAFAAKMKKKRKHNRDK